MESVLNDHSAAVCKIPTGKVEPLQASGSIAVCQLYFCRRPRNSSMNSTMHKGAFASFLSGGFITATVVNPPERKLVKRISVQ